MEKKFNLTGLYNYREKLIVWKKYATRNAKIEDCVKCQKVHAHKTVLLETGEHVCWYCWIRKDSSYAQVIAKPIDAIHVPKAKNAEKSQKPSTVKNAEIVATSKTKVKAKKPIKQNSTAVSSTNPTQVVNEGDLLENVLGEVDSMMTDTSDINELTKLANSVFFDDSIEPEIAEMLESNTSQAVQEIQPSVAETIVKRNETKIVPNSKKVSKAKKSTPVAVKTSITKKPADKITIQKKSKSKKQNVGADSVTQQSHIEPAIQQTYSKYNPIIKGFDSNKSKAPNIWWNIVKYGVVLALVIFCILGLYFASVWQAKSNGANSSTGTLIQIGMINFDKSVESFVWGFTNTFNDLNKLDPKYAILINELNGIVSSVDQKSLFDLAPFFTTGMLTSLMIFSIIGVLWTIPLLIFKNKTMWSMISIITGFMFLVVVIAMFSIGIHAQNSLLDPYKDIDSICKQLLSYKKSGNHEYDAKILELDQFLNSAISKFKSVL